jgi:hypothetical protein
VEFGAADPRGGGQANQVTVKELKQVSSAAFNSEILASWARFRLGAIAVVSLCLFLFANWCPCGADDTREGSSQHRRKSPGPGFWSVMRDVHKQSFSSRFGFMMLLSHPAIREEVGLSEDEYRQLQELNGGLDREIKSLHQSQQDNPVDHQQLVAKIVQQLSEHDRRFIEFLESTIDFDRFISVLVQARGNRSIVHEEVAKRIDLPPERLNELRALSHRVWREQMDELGDQIRQWIRSGESRKGSGDRESGDRESGDRQVAHQNQHEEIKQLLQKAEAKVNESVGQRLTTEQRMALDQLKGTPFQLPEGLFEIRFPPGSGRRGPKGGDHSRGNDR